MQKIILAVMVLFSLNGIAQIPQKIKYNELVYSFDSTTVLIRKGSMNSVYNLKSNSYDIATTKNTLVNFPKSNIYAEIKPELDVLSIHFPVDGKMMQVFGSLDSCYIAIAGQKEGGYFYDYNGEFFEQEINGELLSETQNDLKWTKFEIIKCLPHYYILNHYYDGPMYYMEENGELYVASIDASGIFNTKVNNWDVEPRYKRCFNLNGFVFCLQEEFVKGNTEGDLYVPGRYNYSYNLCQLGFSNSPNRLDNIAKIENQLLSNILMLDTVQRCGDSDYYITKKDGKTGLIRFQLFNPFSPIPEFKYIEILSPQFDELFFEPYFSKIITVERDLESVLCLYHLRPRYGDEREFPTSAEFVIRDSIKLAFGYMWAGEGDPYIISSKNNYSFTIDENDKHGLKIMEESNQTNIIGKHGGFQIEFPNDSLIIVQSYSRDVISNAVVSSILFPGEDSLDQNGNFVYYIDELGQEKSGVFNLNSDTWLIPPTAKSILKTGTGFLIEYSIRSNDRGLYEKSVYSFIDFKHQEIFSRIDAEILFSNPEFLKKVLLNSSSQ